MNLKGPTSIVFPYKIYKNHPCPIVPCHLYRGGKWIDVEAYVDSGASISLFSIMEAQRLGIKYQIGKQTFSMVGDGSLIPVYLHDLPTKIGNITFKATIGFSPRLGVGFNLIGRKGFFSAFDVTFSDSSRKITFQPVKR